MSKKLLKLTGIIVFFMGVLLVTTLIIFRIYGPKHFIPYVMDKVEEETHGRYNLTINSDSVHVHLIAMSLKLGYTEFKRDSTVQDYAGIPFLDKFDVHATFQSIEIGAFQVIRLLFNKKIIVGKIFINQPIIVIHKNIDYEPEEELVEKKDSIAIPTIEYDTDSVMGDILVWEEFQQSRDEVTPYIRVNNFEIVDASFSFYDGRRTFPIQEVNGLDFKVKGFVSDEKDDIEVDDATVHIDSAVSLVSKNIARLKVKGVDIHPDSVHIDNFSFSHIVDRYRINKIKGFRASWLNIGVNDIDILGIHPERLISDSLVNIDKTSIGFLNLYLFKDKEEPVINPKHKALPSQQVREINFPMLIDTLEIDNGKLIIDMEAAQATTPGRLILDDLEFQILNITNIPTELQKNSSMKVQSIFTIDDSINVNFNANFNIPSPDDEFSVTCDVEPFVAPVLNSFLGSQFFIEFPSGKINHFHFELDGNNKANVGTMDMEYENLKIQKLGDYQRYIEGKPKTGFVTGVGNMLIPANRSSQDKSYKPGVMYYEKEYNRDFIHGIVMSLVSGVASSVGFGSKNLEKKQDAANQLDNSSTIKSAEKAQQKAEKAEKKKSN